MKINLIYLFVLSQETKIFIQYKLNHDKVTQTNKQQELLGRESDIFIFGEEFILDF